jgi:rhamnogalacturonan endolyase
LSTHKKHLTRRRLLAASAVGVAGSGAAVAAGTGLLSSASAARFGYTDNGSTYVIGTGASLVFKVSKATGDLTSLVYRGKEYEGYGGRHSHVGPRLLDRRHQAVRDDDDPGH